MGKLLIVIGVILIIIGLIIHNFKGIPLIGRLPGDFHIKRDNFSFYLPLASSILLSLVITLIIYLIRKFS